MWNELHKATRQAIVVCVFVLVLLILASCLTGCAPMTGRYHTWRNDILQTADRARYETRKQVEDTCRASIVNYEADKTTWELYKDHEGAEQRGWADAARVRANTTAIKYNEYILKNSYVFEGNVPDDILAELPLIE